jgi:hypothetical protein
VHDGQTPHACSASIARRGSLSRCAGIVFSVNQKHDPPVLIRQEGRIASRHQTRVRMRWTQAAARTSCSCGRTALMRTAKSCGPDTWTWCQVRWLRSCERQGQESPVPGESRISKAIAQGRPDIRLNLWFLPRAFFTARGPWVSVDTRPFPAPSYFRGYKTMHHSDPIAPRNAVACLRNTTSCEAPKRRLVRRSPTREGGSNPDDCRGESLDCFASLAMTAV